MKTTIFKVIALSGILLLNACSEKVLNLEPINSENSGTYYEIDANCFKALVSCYRSMNLDQLYLTNGDLPTDDAVKGGSSLSDGIMFQEMASFTGAASNALIQPHWANLYQLITRTNEVINQIQKQENLSDNKKIYIAEAKFLRAFAYSKLVLIYGRVPLLDKVLVPADFVSVKRSTTEKEIFDFVKKDLDDAISVLPEKGNIDIGRATKGAARSLKARVCMNETGYFYNDIMKQRAPEYSGINVTSLWQEVYNQTKEVINSGKYTLLPNYASVFEQDGENKSETVFDQQYVNDLSVTAFGDLPGNEVPFRMGVRGFGGWGFNQPKDNLFAEFSQNGDVDPRRECTMMSEAWPVGWGYNIVQNIMMKSNVNENLWMTKIPEYDYKIFKTLRKGVPTLKYIPGGRRQIPVNIRVIRYSDVLLMNAEAAYRLGGKEDEVRNLVNLVRKRARLSTYPLGAFLGDYDANLVPINYKPFPNAKVPDVASTGQALLEDIWHERRVEFALEGIRYYDLIRTGRISKLAYPAAYQAKKGLWPLPQNDVVTYGLQQNDGY